MVQYYIQEILDLSGYGVEDYVYPYVAALGHVSYKEHQFTFDWNQFYGVHAVELLVNIILTTTSFDFHNRIQFINVPTAGDAQVHPKDMPTYIKLYKEWLHANIPLI